MDNDNMGATAYCSFPCVTMCFIKDLCIAYERSLQTQISMGVATSRRPPGEPLSLGVRS